VVFLYILKLVFAFIVFICYNYATMNEEQKKLIEKNIKLMDLYRKEKISKGNIPDSLVDDFKSDLCLYFCNSATKFKKNIGFKFSTFAHGGFDNCWRDIVYRKKPRYLRCNYIPHSDVQVIVEKTFKEKENKIQKDVILNTILKADLSERELDIMSEYYLKGKSLKTIGIKLGISVERVRQIRINAIMKMKKVILRNKMTIGDFYDHD
jgi:RNA polymerase sigma factor (sigma-70 family)